MQIYIDFSPVVELLAQTPPHQLRLSFSSLNDRQYSTTKNFRSSITLLQYSRIAHPPNVRNVIYLSLLCSKDRVKCSSQKLRVMVFHAFSQTNSFILGGRSKICFCQLHLILCIDISYQCLMLCNVQRKKIVYQKKVKN